MLGNNERLPYMLDGRIWNTPRTTMTLCRLVRKLIWGASVVLLLHPSASSILSIP
jgi:hypothetical protein